MCCCVVICCLQRRYSDSHGSVFMTPVSSSGSSSCSLQSWRVVTQQHAQWCMPAQVQCLLLYQSRWVMASSLPRSWPYLLLRCVYRHTAAGSGGRVCLQRVLCAASAQVSSCGRNAQPQSRMLCRKNGFMELQHDEKQPHCNRACNKSMKQSPPPPALLLSVTCKQSWLICMAAVLQYTQAAG
jgi:hypothetical protein